ncbi:hypothetical protein KY309_01590, partial [Candidatus Woesearchaeota archaeon]|nr:hypothetical protein [Candidatus Woesearchaeota archaeon]
MVKDFHEFFGFSRNGINSQVLVSPELDGVKDKQHWFLRKSRYSFLRSAHLGLVVPSDARLFFNMNPSQILGVMVGFYSMVRSGNTGRWIKEPAALYLDLLSRARASYKRELDYIDRVANERAVQIF